MNMPSIVSSRKTELLLYRHPKGVSASLMDWKHQISKTLNLDAYTTDFRQNLPRESVILINDLELWWERTTEGMVVIKEIAEIIHQNSDEVLFIINANSYSFKHINKLVPLNELFISVIECKPFDARQLKQLISERHKSSGLLLFIIRMKMRKVYRSLKWLNCSNQYFRYSQGLPELL